MGPLPPPSTDKGSCLLSCGFFPPPRALRGFSHTRCGIVTPLGAKREADKQAWSHLLSGLKRAPSYLSSQLSHPPRSLGAHRGPTGGQPEAHAHRDPHCNANNWDPRWKPSHCWKQDHPDGSLDTFLFYFIYLFQILSNFMQTAESQWPFYIFMCQWHICYLLF